MRIDVSGASHCFPCVDGDGTTISHLVCVEISDTASDPVDGRDQRECVRAFRNAIIIDMSDDGMLAAHLADDCRKTNEDVRIYHRFERTYRQGDRCDGSPPRIPSLRAKLYDTSTPSQIVENVRRLEGEVRPILVVIDTVTVDMFGEITTVSALERKLGVDGTLPGDNHLVLSREAFRKLHDSVVVDPTTPTVTDDYSTLVSTIDAIGYRRIVYGGKNITVGWLSSMVTGQLPDHKERSLPVTVSIADGIVVSACHGSGIMVRSSRKKLVTRTTPGATVIYILLANERKDVALSVTCGPSLKEYTIPSHGTNDRYVAYGVMSVGVWGAEEDGQVDSMIRELHAHGACNILDVTNSVYMMHCSKCTDDPQASAALRIAAGISWATAFLTAKRPEKQGETNLHYWAELTATDASREIFGSMNVAPSYPVFPNRSESCAAVR